jgi:hypothetical protein
MLDPTTYMPVVVEATKFLFSEAGKWLDALRGKDRRASAEGPAASAHDEKPALTAEIFSQIEADPGALAQLINRQQAEANAYEIGGLVEQIKIHRKNLTDHETVEAEYGALTPTHVKRAIERETAAIVEKSARLKGLLERVYQERIRYV